MRVLHVTTIYPSEAQPQQGSFVKAQIDSLVKAGVECDVFPMSVAEARTPGTWRRVAEKVASATYDLVHVHFGYALPAALRVRRCPLVVSFCGTDVMGSGEWRGRILVAMSNLLALRADACIAKSESLRDHLWFKRLRDRCRVIPNGIDFSVFHPIDRDEARKHLGLDAAGRYVLFAGDYQRKLKRLDIIEAAVARVRETLPDAELLKIRGLPQDQLNLYYSAADCLALASDHEGSPNVVKEALACNLPVVSVDVGDVREVLGTVEGCRIVPRTGEAFAQALGSLLESPSRIAGRSAVEHLRVEKIAERVINVYRKVLETAGDKTSRPSVPGE